MGENKRRQELSRLLHLGLLGASPHALSPHFIPEISQSLMETQREHPTGECLNNFRYGWLHDTPVSKPATNMVVTIPEF